MCFNWIIKASRLEFIARQLPVVRHASHCRRLILDYSAIYCRMHNIVTHKAKYSYTAVDTQRLVLIIEMASAVAVTIIPMLTLPVEYAP